jgi:hypothetical protein
MQMPTRWVQGLTGTFGRCSFDDKLSFLLEVPPHYAPHLDAEGVAYHLEMDIVDLQIKEAYGRTVRMTIENIHPELILRELRQCLLTAIGILGTQLLFGAENVLFQN